MEMPLHNLNFLCTATERTNTRKEEKLGKLQTLSSTNQTAIKALITSLCCTKSFLPFYGQSGNTWAWKQPATRHNSQHLLIKSALSSRCKTISQQNMQGCGTCQSHRKNTPCISQPLHREFSLHRSATPCMPRQLPGLPSVHRDVLPVLQSHHPLTSVHLHPQPLPCSK